MKKSFQMMKKNSNIDDVIRLIDLRIAEKGWKTRRQLAQALNKTESWLSNVMNKKRGLSIQTLFEIASALEIDPASLLPEAKNPRIKASFEEYIRKIVKDEIDKIKKEE